jgi:pimeloyl-ACP methyl ester carboxylesterase
MKLVLVHGAWCDGSSWTEVIKPLQAAGHEVLGVQLPLTSLEADIAATNKAIATLGGPVGLIGHSYGGAVITAAGSGNEAVAGLIYVAAYAPAEGETVLALGERFPQTAGGGAIRPDEEGFLALDREMFPEVFAADVPIEQAKVLAAVQKLTHGSCFGTPLAVEPGWQKLPCAYIASANDQMINPEGQQWMAERIGANVTTLDSSHASPVSHGPAVAAAILAALGA